MHPLCHESKLPCIHCAINQTAMHPLCHESKLPCIHCAMNPNCHGSILPRIQTTMDPCTIVLRLERVVHTNGFSPVRVCMYNGKSQVITMPVRIVNTYNSFSPKCLLTLEHLKGVHFLQTNINTEYNHIASYQYEAA